MAITFVNNGTASTGGSAATCVVTLPASLQANDIVIAQIVILAVETITPPANWTQIRSDGNSQQQTLFWHLVTNSSESSTTATFSFTAAFKTGDCIAYRGCDTVTPINANTGQFSNSTTSFGNAAITPTVDSGMALFFWGWNGTAAATLSGTPTLTQRYTIAPSGGFRLTVGEVAAPSSGTAIALNNYLCAQSPATNANCGGIILAPAITPSGAQPELFRRSFSNIQKIAYIRNLLAKPPIP